MRVVIFLMSTLALAALPANAGDCCAGGDCCSTADCCAAGHASKADAPSAAETAREYATVTFVDPVWVGDKVLMGEYIIEHDTDRMARGGPCTHIYAAKDRRNPVVAFHCKHLRRPASGRASVTLRRNYNAGGHAYLLTEFQFAGSPAAHGVPRVRGVPPVR
jgi:hypothetical protein